MARQRGKSQNASQEQIHMLLERVVAIYQRNFAGSDEAKNYLESRGITDASLYAQHRIGYSNGSMNAILPKDSEHRAELRSIGILNENDGERLNGCVIFPIYDVDGNIVNLCGRYIDDPTTKLWKADVARHVYLPNRPKSSWNIGIVKTYPEIILADSIFDAMSLEIAGYRNVVSVLGGDGYTDRERKVFEGNGVQKLLRLPDDCDPNDILVKKGKDKLTAAVKKLLAPVTGHSAMSGPQQSRQNYDNNGDGVCFTAEYGPRRYEIMGLEKGPRKLKATVRISHAGEMHIDTLNLYVAAERKRLCHDLCLKFTESPNVINADISRLVDQCRDHDTLADDNLDPDTPVEVSGKDKDEAEAFGKSPDLVNNILADFERCGLIGEDANKLLCYLGVTSRKMSEPLAVLILSSSGAGKTVVMDAAINFCPTEDLIKLTSVSGKALFYKRQMSLKHKVLAMAEISGVEDADYAIRNLITGHELTSESTVKDINTGKLVTMVNKVEGPTAVFLTTTDPAIDPETKSRFFVTGIDESRKQTRAILQSQRRRETIDGLYGGMDNEAILSRHRNFQRLLMPLAVVNPYAEQLTFGDDRLQGRRDQPKYLNLIKSVAFLRQMTKEVKLAQRNGKATQYVEVDAEDIRIANNLAVEILGRSLDELSRPGRDLLMLLDEMVAKKTERTDIEFSRRDIREYAGWKDYRVHTAVTELVELEYLMVVSGRNGSQYRYRLAYEGQGKQGSKFVLGLKAPEELK